MKKVIVSISIVLAIIVGVASMIAVAFASWDITDALADIETGEIGTDIKLSVTVNANDKDTKKLIPSNAEIFNTNTESTEIKIASFKVKLSNNDANITESQLANKVNFTTSEEKVTLKDGTAIKFTPDNSQTAYEWNRYFTIGIYKSGATKPSLIDNVGDYTIKLSFNTLSGVSDAKEQEFIRSLSGKQFKVSFKLTISAKSAI